MKLDTTKIDDAVLALLYLGLHDEARAKDRLDHRMGPPYLQVCDVKSTAFWHPYFAAAHFSLMKRIPSV